MLSPTRQMTRLVCCVSIAVLFLLVGFISTAGSTHANIQQPLRGVFRHEDINVLKNDGSLQLGTAGQAKGTLLRTAGTASSGHPANPAAGFPAYPKGDCATQCSMDLATRMAHCQADPSVGIPATQCAAAPAPGTGDDTCPTVRYPDAV